MDYVIDVNIKEGTLFITLLGLQADAKVDWQGVWKFEDRTAEVCMTGCEGDVKFRVNGGQWFNIDVDQHRAMYRAARDSFSFGV